MIEWTTCTSVRFSRSRRETGKALIIKTTFMCRHCWIISIWVDYTTDCYVSRQINREPARWCHVVLRVIKKRSCSQSQSESLSRTFWHWRVPRPSRLLFLHKSENGSTICGPIAQIGPQMHVHKHRSAITIINDGQRIDIDRKITQAGVCVSGTSVRLRATGLGRYRPSVWQNNFAKIVKNCQK